MPSRDWKNASQKVAANGSSQNVLVKQEGISPDLSHNGKIHYNSDSDGDLSPTPFPSLTGLKSRTSVEEQETITIGSKVAFVD